MQRLSLIIVLVSAMFTCPAIAQDADTMRPISRADLRGYAKLLDLTDEQVQVVEMLHQGYMQALQRENAAMREATEAAMRAFNPEAFDESAAIDAQRAMAKASMDHLRVNLELQSQLFDDMRAVLEAEQLEVFPRVERMRRRQMLLGEMPIAWSQVDLVDCLQTLDLSSQTSGEFEEGVISYEIAMDRELTRVFDFMLEMIERGPEMMMGEDQAEMMEMMERVYGWMHTMRTINKQHARTLGAMLSDPDRERFDLETRNRAFPRVYRESETTRAINIAAGFADLSADQPERIEALHVQLAVKLDTANQRWAEALDQEGEDADFQSLMMSFTGGGQRESNLAEAARDELDAIFQERLEAILTDEQIERLPKERPAGQQMLVPAGG